jgi:toxin ParE1/3/4
MLADTAGPDVAARYRREIDGLYDRLVMFPRSGGPRPSFGRHARIGVVSPYVVIYDYRPDTVTILRILDGRRNITRRLVRQ